MRNLSRIQKLKNARIVSERRLEKLNALYENVALHEGLENSALALEMLSEAARFERIVLLEMLTGKTSDELVKSYTGIMDSLEPIALLSPEVVKVLSAAGISRNDALLYKEMFRNREAELKPKLESALANVMTFAKAMMAVSTALDTGELGSMLNELDQEKPLRGALMGKTATGKRDISKMVQEPVAKEEPKEEPEEKVTDYLAGLPPPERKVAKFNPKFSKGYQARGYTGRELRREGIGDFFKKKVFGVPGLSAGGYTDFDKKFSDEIMKVINTKAPGAAKLFNVQKFVADLKKNASAKTLKAAFKAFDRDMVKNVDDKFLRTAVMTASKTPFLKSVWDTLSGGLATRARM